MKSMAYAPVVIIKYWNQIYVPVLNPTEIDMEVLGGDYDKLSGGSLRS